VILDLGAVGGACSPRPHRPGHVLIKGQPQQRITQLQMD